MNPEIEGIEGDWNIPNGKRHIKMVIKEKQP